MLIIVEGLDHSGKSTIASLLHSHLQGSLLIKKTYRTELYPINYSVASEYDWQAIFDRVILPNRDMTFIADRSFFTQTVYQLLLGTGEHEITDGQAKMFNAYCKVLTSMPHLVIYCKSCRYELDSMVTNLTIRAKLDGVYQSVLQEQQDINLEVINMDNGSLYSRVNDVLQKIKQIEKNYVRTN